METNRNAENLTNSTTLGEQSNQSNRFADSWLNKDCNGSNQLYLEPSSTGGNRQSTDVRREPGKARMGVGKRW